MAFSKRFLLLLQAEEP